MERTALFPGTFNPFTKGHQDIVARALPLFDKIVIGVGINPGKASAGDSAAAADDIRRLYAGEPRVEVLAYEGLTADFVRETGACCIIRGIRNPRDLDYETSLARANFTLFGVETIFLLADPRLKEISSSLVRELKAFGKDVSELMP